MHAYKLALYLASLSLVSCGPSADAPDDAATTSPPDFASVFVAPTPRPRVSMQLRRVYASVSTEPTATARCPAGSLLVGGGCRCGSLSHYVQSAEVRPNEQEYRCVCFTPTPPASTVVMAQAICLSVDGDNASVNLEQLPDIL